MNVSSKKFYFISFLVVFLLIVVRQQQVDNYGCELCADKAGYYFYLPAVFQLGFTTQNYPAGFDHKHGDGFHLNYEKNKVITKFTCGVALLLSPFYSVGYVISKILSINPDPYSTYYLFFINIGAAFYLVLGIFFLRKWLEKYVAEKTALLSAILIFFSTNLFYYTLDESLMSHLYSFTMFTGILFAISNYKETREQKFFILFMICLSLAILIRPINFFFGIIALFLDVTNFEQLKKKIRLLISRKNILTGGLISFMIFLPQLLYWKFAYGNFFVWSYEGEGFTNLSHPHFMTVWFSTQSGLFPYTPLILVGLLLAMYMIIKKIPNGPLVIFTFFVTSYMCAAWHNPFFGTCNFGKRPMVEYLPILMMPLFIFLNRFSAKKAVAKILIATALIFFTWYNQALFSSFNTCFPGGEWDYEEFMRLLIKGATIIR